MKGESCTQSAVLTDKVLVGRVKVHGDVLWSAVVLGTYCGVRSFSCLLKTHWPPMEGRLDHPLTSRPSAPFVTPLRKQAQGRAD